MMIDLQHVALTYQSPDGEVEALRDISFQMELPLSLVKKMRSGLHCPILLNSDFLKYGV